MKEYFDIKSDKWKITVKWCLKIGVVIDFIAAITLAVKM